MDIKKIRLIADRILIEPLKSGEKTRGGIHIPDTAKEKPQQGKVIAAGKGTKDASMTVKKGDTVLYGKYSGAEIRINGIDYLFMKESDMYAIIK